jgi:8-amino-7-oxononanoate synthase
VVLDFTSALYLGLEHNSQSLPGWESLTLGKPAALQAPQGADRVERRLAELIGCERALLARSTLHLFWDLFALLAQANVNIFLDAGSYPIVQWGVERAACSGTLVKRFRQHDPEALKKALASADEKPPVIVTDGYCPGCGRPAPLAEYLELTRTRSGFVVVDDSQVLGIFGRPAPWASYGTGGGGSMQRQGISSNRCIIGSSLAKAFGAPVAVLAGSSAIVGEFESRSATRVHCSPPSASDIAATTRSLAINDARGDALRTKLAQRVSLFRQGLQRLGLVALSGLFPVQPIHLPDRVNVQRFHDELSQRGVEAVLHRRQGGKRARISFVVTARHSPTEIEQALVHLAGALANQTKNASGKEFRRWSTRITTQGV